MTYYCNYAFTEPNILTDRINDTFEDVWASWYDLDEDTFVLSVHAIFAEDLDESTKEQIEKIIAPYLQMD